jgi:hypothetical protein
LSFGCFTAENERLSLLMNSLACIFTANLVIFENFKEKRRKIWITKD